MSLPDSSTMRKAPPRAVLVGIQLPTLDEQQVEASLDELGRLCATLGVIPVARLTQRRSSIGSATVLGSGKLAALAELTGGKGAVPNPVPGWRRQRGTPAADDAEAPGTVPADDDDDDDGAVVVDDDLGRPSVVVFDHDLSPRQLKNLEAATGAEVLDRSSVILRIFHRHARSREARLQVEIAELRYLAPRLRATGGGGDRQQGGIGGRGGAGESSLELDRRRVRDRIVEITRELELVEREVSMRRERRGSERMVALIGYTNAGKSTLMRALTGAQVLVKDQLFATLDTTVRALHPEARPRILVSDTVGFIDRLPHDLVASFRSTLAEAREASLLVHVVDASHPGYRDQMRVTESVLRELGAGDRPHLVVLNKADRLDEEQRLQLARSLPAAILASAIDPASVAAVHEHIVRWFERDAVDAELFVPYTEPRRMHEVHERARVLAETHEETGTRVRVRAPADVVADLRGPEPAESVSGATVQG